MDAFRKIVSGMVLVLAVFGLVIFVASLPGTLALMHTRTAYALGLLTGRLIGVFLLYLIYRWLQGPRD
jgi:hypothetical protein